MKTTYLFLTLTAVLSGLSCTDKYTEELTVNAPVYMGYEELRSAVGLTSARELVHPGKIYFRGYHIFIVEYLEGVHIIDVSDTSNPRNTGFIEIPGCVDIAVKDRLLYADSYVDLVTIDISDLSNPKETKRITQILPYTVPSPDEPEYPQAEIDQNKGVVVGWEVKLQKREIKTQDAPVAYYPDQKMWSLSEYAAAPTSDASSSGSTSVGISGSMARFGVYESLLYVATTSQLYMFDLTTPSSPASAGSTWLSGSNIETMFIYDGHLFFGTPTGMLIYTLAVPLMPQFVGNFWHTTSCDPVVVQDGYAYITLRTGTECSGMGVNRLDIVKVSDDYLEYELVSSYAMTNPHGLGIDGNRLFICDGPAGLKVYDVTDKNAVSSHLVASFPNIRTYDVIPVEGFLFMIGDDGFYLYDYTDPANIHQTGHIPVAQQAD